GLVLDHRDQLRHRAATRGLDLVLDLDAGCLLVGGNQHLLEVLVEVLHVRALARERDGGRLGLRVATDEGPRGHAGGSGGKLQEVTAGRLRLSGLCHVVPPCVWTWTARRNVADCPRGTPGRRSVAPPAGSGRVGWGRAGGGCACRRGPRGAGRGLPEILRYLWWHVKHWLGRAGPAAVISS